MQHAQQEQAVPLDAAAAQEDQQPQGGGHEFIGPLPIALEEEEEDEDDSFYTSGMEDEAAAAADADADEFEDDEDESDVSEEDGEAQGELEAVEDDDDDEEEEEEGRMTGARIISMLLGHSSRHGLAPAAHNALASAPRLPLPLVPLSGSDLAAGLNARTRAMDVGQANPIWACLDGSFDAIHLPTLTTEDQQRRHKQQAGFARVHPPPPPPTAAVAAAAAAVQDAAAAVPAAAGGGYGGGGGGIATRTAARRRAAAAAAPDGDGGPAAAAAAAAGGSGSDGSNSSSSSSSSGFQVVNTASLLLKRELSMNRQAGLSRAQQQHIACHRALPLHPQKVRDAMSSRAYIGQYSANGEFFIAAFQDKRVRLYDTQRNWRLRKDVTTRMTRWTITDTTMSPDQRLLVYASISPVAFVVNVGSSYDVVESRANITELHEPLAFDGSQAPGADERRARGEEDEWADRSFGIWSIAWSPQGGQLIAGTNNNSVYVLDIESKLCLTRLTGHGDDVNAVAFLTSDSPHLIVSGSDDSFVRVWDTRDRTSGGSMRQAQGVLVGHTDGLTHLCARGDGVHLISNCKDQTIKLWDVRAALSPPQAAAAARQRPRIPRWDYRWETYPAAGLAVKHPADVSLMTYRGHSVLQTLVRAYFSPQHTTGQRFIYAGSAEQQGSSMESDQADILVWDVVSGKQVARLQYHSSLVRDCSWHPFEPELTSVSWEGRVVSWGPQLPQQRLPRSDRDVLRGYY